MDDCSSLWPNYACAILLSPDQSIWLEDRPLSARHARGLLTCFGGRREPQESPEECLRRELQEELDWSPVHVQKSVELWVGHHPMAWFYLVQPAAHPGDLHPRGAPARLIAWKDLFQNPVSPWHRAVLEAWHSGIGRVDLPAEITPPDSRVTGNGETITPA